MQCKYVFPEYVTSVHIHSRTVDYSKCIKVTNCKLSEIGKTLLHLPLAIIELRSSDYWH